MILLLYIQFKNWGMSLKNRSFHNAFSNKTHDFNRLQNYIQFYQNSLFYTV